MANLQLLDSSHGSFPQFKNHIQPTAGLRNGEKKRGRVHRGEIDREPSGEERLGRGGASTRRRGDAWAAHTTAALAAGLDGDGGDGGRLDRSEEAGLTDRRKRGPSSWPGLGPTARFLRCPNRGYHYRGQHFETARATRSAGCGVRPSGVYLLDGCCHSAGVPNAGELTIHDINLTNDFISG